MFLNAALGSMKERLLGSRIGGRAAEKMVRNFVIQTIRTQTTSTFSVTMACTNYFVPVEHAWAKNTWQAGCCHPQFSGRSSKDKPPSASSDVCWILERNSRSLGTPIRFSLIRSSWQDGPPKTQI